MKKTITNFVRTIREANARGEVERQRELEEMPESAWYSSPFGLGIGGYVIGRLQGAYLAGFFSKEDREDI